MARTPKERHWKGRRELERGGHVWRRFVGFGVRVARLWGVGFLCTKEAAHKGRLVSPRFNGSPCILFRHTLLCILLSPIHLFSVCPPGLSHSVPLFPIMLPILFVFVGPLFFFIISTLPVFWLRSGSSVLFSQVLFTLIIGIMFTLGASGTVGLCSQFFRSFLAFIFCETYLHASSLLKRHMFANPVASRSLHTDERLYRTLFLRPYNVALVALVATSWLLERAQRLPKLIFARTGSVNN